MAIIQNAPLELSPDSFTRLNDTNDIEYCASEGAYAPFDPVTAHSARKLIASIIGAQTPDILDLYAGEDSYLDEEAKLGRVVGIGPAAGAMQRNTALTERTVLDLNTQPQLPLSDDSFDVVLLSGVAPYLQRPVELLCEASRVLRPGGQLIVSISTDFVAERVIKFWRRGGEDERLAYMHHVIELSDAFDDAQVRLAPARSGARPVITVFASTPGGTSVQPSPAMLSEQTFSDEEIAERKKNIGSTMRCPYCDIPLTKFKIPDIPFCEWDAEFMWVCFHEACPFTGRSLSIMREQGNMGVAYRLMYDRDHDIIYTVPDVGFCDRG